MRTWNWGSVAGKDAASLGATLNQRLKDLSGVVSRGERVVSIAADYSVGWADDYVLADCALGNVRATLPPVASVPGQIVMIGKSDKTAGTLTVDGNGALIDGSADLSTTTSYAGWLLLSDGDAWHVVGGQAWLALPGQPNGVASLDAGGRVPESQLPNPPSAELDLIAYAFRRIAFLEALLGVEYKAKDEMVPPAYSLVAESVESWT